MRDRPRRVLAVFLAVIMVLAAPIAIVELGGPDLSPIGTASAEPYNVTTASFTQSFDVSGQDTSVTSVGFSDDGSKMFVTGGANDNVYEYDLSTAFDISTASFSQSFNVSSEDGSPSDVTFNGDGSKMFVTGDVNDNVYEYDLTTGFDVSTASFSQSFNLSDQDSSIVGLAFNGDGSKMFVMGADSEDVYEYDLTTGFDVSTASFSQSFNVSGQDTGPSDVGFNGDGTKMFTTGGANDNVYEYDLTTAYDVSTASFSQSFDVSAQDTGPSSVTFDDTGSKMFVSGNANDDVYEYDLHDGTVSGTVVNQNGDAVSNATVELWQINDANTTKDSGQTLEEAQRETIKTITRAVPRDRFNPDIDPVNSETFTGSGAGRMVLVHEEGAYFEGNVRVLGQEIPIGTPSRDLSQPLIRLEPNTQYAFSIWDRSKESLIEDAIDNKVDPGSSDGGTILIEQIGPGNSTVREIEVETEPQVQSATFKKHEYATVSLPTGYYVLRPKQGGAPLVVRVGSPEDIPRTFEKDLKDVSGNAAEIAKEISGKVDSGELTRATVETNATGHFSYNVPRGYSTVAITVFDGRGLTEGITNPTLQDLRTQIQQQDYNGSIYLSSSPTIAHPPESGIEVTVVEIERPTFSDLQAYLDLLGWLDELINEESFAEISTLWTDPPNSVTDEEIRDRAKELDDLVRQNEDLRDQLRNLNNDVDRLRDELDDGTISREDSEDYLDDLIKAIQESHTNIDVGAEDPEFDVPESDSEPTLLNLRLPINTEAGQDSSLTKEGVTVLVHFDNGSSTTMPETYYSVDNNVGASQGTGSAVVIEEYPIASDIAVASIEVLVANGEGVGRTEVPVQNPAFEGTPPQLASINVGTMRPGPDETLSITVTPTDSSTFREVVDASVYGPNGTELSTTVSGSKISFTTNGQGSHLVQLVISDGSHNYTETIRVKAGSESINYPASVRVHNGVLGKTLIASDGVESAELSVSRGGSVAQITAKVDGSDVPREIHVHAREITGIQQDVTISVVSSSDESQVTRPVRVKLHLSRLSEEALVRANDRAITEEASRHGKVEHLSDSTLVTTIAEGGSAEVSVNNNPSLLARILFSIDLEFRQRIPSIPGAMIAPPVPAPLAEVVA